MGGNILGKLFIEKDSYLFNLLNNKNERWNNCCLLCICVG